MNLKFDINIPNEPYSSDDSEGKTITCTYTGFPFLVIGVDPNTNRVQTVDYKSEEEKTDLSDFVDDVLVFHSIAVDASNVFAAAFLTKDYTNPGTTYSEVIDADHTFEYIYDENNCIGDIYNTIGGIKYDSVTKTFDTTLSYLSHPISEADFLQSVADKTTEWKEIQAAGNLDTETQQEVDDYVAWLESAPTKYNGVNHWKWPYPPSPTV